MSNVTLDNVGGEGAAEELFREKLAVVLADIADPNAKAKAKREITIKVVFPVDEDRQMFAPEVSVAYKLAPREPVRGPYIEVGTGIDGKPEAVQVRGQTQGRFEFQTGDNVEKVGNAVDEKVVEMRKKS